MNIGIEIQSRQVALAISENTHFSVLETYTSPETLSFAQIAEWMTQALPSQTEEGEICMISLPSLWSIRERNAFTTALHDAGITQYLLIPDCIAILAALKNQDNFPEDADLLYIAPHTAAENPASSSVFSFVSCFSCEPAPLWEGTFCGDSKFLRKMAHTLGYLHKSHWSSHLVLSGEKQNIQSFFASSAEKNLPLWETQEETVLQGITLFQETARNLSSRLHYRCHSRFYLKNQADTNSAENMLLLPFSGALLPLPWNDYYCLHFFSETENLFLEESPQPIWRIYERTFGQKKEETEPSETFPPLLSFSLTEPSGLWLSSNDGHIELLPFMENAPQPPEVPSPLSPAEELESILHTPSDNSFFNTGRK